MILFRNAYWRGAKDKKHKNVLHIHASLQVVFLHWSAFHAKLGQSVHSAHKRLNRKTWNLHTLKSGSADLRLHCYSHLGLLQWCMWDQRHNNVLINIWSFTAWTCETAVALLHRRASCEKKLNVVVNTGIICWLNSKYTLKFFIFFNQCCISRIGFCSVMHTMRLH